MRYLVEAPVRAAQELSWQLSTVETLEELRRVALQLLVRLFEADSSGLTDVTLGRNRSMRFEMYPDHPAEKLVADALFEQLSADLFCDNPVMEHYFFRPAVTARPVRLSDLVTERELSRTKAYGQVLRLIDGRYQVVIPARLDPATESTAFAPTRGASDFGDDSLVLAEAVQPVLVAVWAALRVRDSARPGPGSERADPLTARELEVLGLVAAGMTATSVGHALRISHRTVCKHVENAYVKLDVHDRVTAVARAQRLGLLR